jgi:transposase InsO family protein
LESGASTHMCPHEKWFKVLRSRKRTDILLGDESTIACNKERTINFLMGFRGRVIRFALENVLFTPGLKHTLISCSALSSAGCETLFTADHCTLIDSKTRSGPETIARIRPRNGIYYVPAVAHIKQRHAAHSTSSNYLRDGHDTSSSTGPAAQLAHNEVVDHWHCRLGHAGRNRVRQLMRNGELLTIPDTPICDSCVRGKQRRDSFTGSIFTAAKPGDVIHSDVAGPLPRSHSGCRYTLSFIDEYSRYVMVFAMKRKSDVLGCLKSFLHEFERRQETKIKAVHSDNGGEYTPVAKFATGRGITVHLSAPYAPQANGIAERANRTIFEMARTTLVQSGLPNTFWAEAVSNAAAIRNRLPQAGGMSPFEKLYGHKPSVNKFRPLDVWRMSFNSK